MKRLASLFMILLLAQSARAWWDPGHLLTAMIAYMQLDEQARSRVDELTTVLERDYPYVNHFIATGPWPDDLKAEGVRAYNTWHYTNIPYNWQGVPLPPQQKVDVIWAINEAQSILRSSRSREVDKARFLGFLVHFVSDLHQPLHSTSVHDNDLPAGNAGGNGFYLEGPWRNLHSLWDDAGGYLEAFNSINPYGQPKDGLTADEIERFRQFALKLMQEYPSSKFSAVDELDPDFWALESHKLAIRYGYRGVNGKDSRGRNQYLEPGGTPSDLYLENVQETARRQLVLSGYRLGRILNQLFGEEEQPKGTEKEVAEVLAATYQILEAINTKNPDLARPVLLEDAVFYSIRESRGKQVVGTETAKKFLSGLKKGRDKYVERMWNPQVSLQGDVATVRAPYDFHVNGNFSHCGTDLFNLIKTAEGWKITSITYDVVTEGCEPSPLGAVGGMKNEE
jgi:hypothetical protein